MSDWIAVGRADHIPLWEGRRVTVDGHRLAIFHTDSGFHAIDGDCPHASGPLQDGLVADGCVTCPLHGWRFDLRDGSQIGGDSHLRTYPVEVRDGVLMVATSAGVPA